MKAALIQYSPEWENKENNIIKLNEMLDNPLLDEKLIILPEMTLTGFTMESKKNAEEIDGIGMQYFIDKSHKLKKHILAGIIEKNGDKTYNSLYHFDDKGLINSRYRKLHPFSYAKEEEYYQAGKESVITKAENISIGLSICYDLRFPELYRIYGKQRAEILVNIANWPDKRIHHWKVLLQSHAIANQCYAIGVNRVGQDPFNNYNGCSAIFDPMGDEVTMVENEEKVISAELDLDRVKKVRDKFRFLDDIRLI